MQQNNDFGNRLIPTISPSLFWRGMAFGSLAGMLVGTIAGVTCYEIIDADDPFIDGSFNGSLLGFIVGAIIGKLERRKKEASAESSIATLIGVLFGLIPGCLVFLEAIGIVQGTRTGFVAIGSFFVCPMVGLCIGGALDRIYDAVRRS